MRIALRIAAAACVAAAGAAPAVAQSPAPASVRVSGPQFRFEAMTFDFGAIAEGAAVEHVFAFKNVGTEPIVISEIRPSCGCVTPEWSKEPVGPGRSGVITLRFNTAGRPGPFAKSAEIESNVPPAPGEGGETLRIVGTVVP